MSESFNYSNVIMRDILLLTVKSFVKAFRTTLAKYFTLRFVKVFCKVHCKVVGKVLYNFRDI